MYIHTYTYIGTQNNFVVKHISRYSNNNNNNNNINNNNEKIKQSNSKSTPPVLPKQIWLMFGGNAQLALDWHDMIIDHMVKLQEKTNEKDSNSWTKPNEVEYLVSVCLLNFFVFELIFFFA